MVTIVQLMDTHEAFVRDLMEREDPVRYQRYPRSWLFLLRISISHRFSLGRHRKRPVGLKLLLQQMPQLFDNLIQVRFNLVPVLVGIG